MNKIKENMTFLLIPFVILWALIILPFILIGKLLVKGTKEEFNSDKKELLFGRKIMESMTGLEKAGFQVETKTDGKQSHYSVKTSDYALEVDINTDEIGLDFWVLVNPKLSMLYSVNTDLYPISNQRNHKMAKEIEDEIVSFLDELSSHKVKVGTYNGFPGYAIQKGDKYFVNYSKPGLFGGVFWSSDEMEKLNLEELEEKGNFITI